jgi:hypothetical protein
MPFALTAWQWPQKLGVWVALASLGFWGGLGHLFLILLIDMRLHLRSTPSSISD